MTVPRGCKYSGSLEASRAAEKTGTTLPKLPETGIELSLDEQQNVTFVLPPGGKPKTGDGKVYGGILTIDQVATPGVHQVTLNAPAWIDVVQNGAALAAVAHTGSKDCAQIRKSVRFEIGAGPVTIQISGAPASTIAIAVRKGE